MGNQDLLNAEHVAVLLADFKKQYSPGDDWFPTLRDACRDAPSITRVIDRIQSLEQENARLKEALEDIANRGTGNGGAQHVTVTLLRSVARAALGKGKL